jgi:ribosomal protein S2
VDYIIPGNDDAIRAVKLFASIMADAVLEGLEGQQEQEAMRIEAEKAVSVDEAEQTADELSGYSRTFLEAGHFARPFIKLMLGGTL